MLFVNKESIFQERLFTGLNRRIALSRCLQYVVGKLVTPEVMVKGET